MNNKKYDLRTFINDTVEGLGLASEWVVTKVNHAINLVIYKQIHPKLFASRWLWIKIRANALYVNTRYVLGRKLMGREIVENLIDVCPICSSGIYRFPEGQKAHGQKPGQYQVAILPTKNIIPIHFAVARTQVLLEMLSIDKRTWMFYHVTKRQYLTKDFQWEFKGDLSITCEAFDARFAHPIEDLEKMCDFIVRTEVKNENPIP